ncbi:MAG: rhodanese-like domain-containing protein [Pseudomonadota bacterium]
MKAVKQLRSFAIALTALCGLALVGSHSATAGDGYSLPKLEQSIAKRFPTVDSLTLQQFQAAHQGNQDVIILDVRETGEFNVSRLARSERVDPGISKLEFLKRFAANARGKTFVLYCSVGYRSSKLAASIQQSLKQAGAQGVYNLQGGIFAWHNDAKPLVKAGKTPTRLVHPYSDKWGRYLTNRDLTSYGKSSGWRIFN